MNWGYKLLLVFAAFAGLMSYMVYRCVRTPVNLVTNEYYRDELVYQDVIEQKNNARALSGAVLVRQDGEGISIHFPREIQQAGTSGTILFYCASDASRDRKIPVSLDAAGCQRVDARSFFPGQYVVKIQWETNHVKYYSEEPFTVL